MATAITAKAVTRGLKPSDIAAILAAQLASPDKHSTLITGPPAIGKTSVIKQAAALAGQDVIFTDLATADPTNANGFPWIVKSGTGAKAKERAVFIPFGDVQRLIESTKPTVWVWDDLGWAPDSVQKAFAHGLDEGRFGDVVLPKHVTVIGSTNLRGQGAGVTGILEPVKSRFTTILPMAPHFPDFQAWWYKQTHLPLEVIAYLSQKPSNLHDWQPTKDVVNQPAPRTWEAAGKILNLHLPEHLELEALKGTVGDVAAVDFVSLLRVMREGIDLDAILSDPHNAPIPERSKIGMLFAIAQGLSTLAERDNFEDICTYMERMVDKGLAEFAMLILQRSTQRDSTLCQTKAFTKIVTSKGKLAKLIANLES